MATTLTVKTKSHTEIVDITSQIKELIPADFSGGCLLFCQNTTAALTINENADPDVKTDMLADLERVVPWDNSRFRHLEGNSAAHLKSSLLGPNLQIPVVGGRLTLGTWQGLYLCEFDGPRSRKVVVQLLAEEGSGT
ncbi:MAG: secondary thiamine-phosphate synthase enzyme YjbQ [Verrucomicrobiota bacterium]